MVNYYTAADTLVTWVDTNDCRHCGSTASTITATDTWPKWVVSASTTTATSSIAQMQTWIQWANNYAIHAGGSGGNVIDQYYRERARPRPRQMSAEELALHAQYERDTERKYQEERTARIAAEAKAEQLLQRLLTAEQRDSLEKNQHFYLHSAGKKYRIDRGRTGNVKLVDERDEVIESYCIHPSGVPDADTMAAQKLMLEADPETFVRVANITRRDGSHRAGTPLRFAVG